MFSAEKWGGFEVSATHSFFILKYNFESCFEINYSLNLVGHMHVLWFLKELVLCVSSELRHWCMNWKLQSVWRNSLDGFQVFIVRDPVRSCAHLICFSPMDLPERRWKRSQCRQPHGCSWNQTTDLTWWIDLVHLQSVFPWISQRYGDTSGNETAPKGSCIFILNGQ